MFAGWGSVLMSLGSSFSIMLMMYFIASVCVCVCVCVCGCVCVRALVYTVHYALVLR